MKDMLKFRLVFRMVLAFMVIAAFSGAGIAAEFSADLVIQVKGEPEVTGKIFVKGSSIRQEVTEDGETQIMIVRLDKSVTWMLTPEEKTYMEIPYQSANTAFEEWSPDREKNAKLLGEETVFGIPSKKYEVVEDEEKAYFWVSKKLSFPVKVEDYQAIMEYKNIKEGAISESLFEIPAGYEKVTAPVLPPEMNNPKE
ncbi:MAG: DUF4412 domain-containing protein [Syntrophobacteraceae bacterium]